MKSVNALKNNLNMLIYCLDSLNVHLYFKQVHLWVSEHYAAMHLRETKQVKSDTGNECYYSQYAFSSKYCWLDT